MEPKIMVDCKSHEIVRERVGSAKKNLYAVKEPQNGVVSGGMGQSILTQMGWELKKLSVLGIKKS